LINKKISRITLFITIIFGAFFLLSFSTPLKAAEETATYLLAKEPYAEGRWFDNSDLFPRVIAPIDTTTRYFVRLTFSDPEANATASNNFIDQLKACSVYSEGGSMASMIDTQVLDYLYSLDEDKQDSFIATYLFKTDAANKRVYLYVPIKELRPHTTYIVNIQPDIIKYGETAGNEAVTWSFATMAIPSVRSISPGSISENYDVRQPVIIHGDNFNINNNVTVKFNDILAYRVDVKTDVQDKKYLQVLLPRGSKRLEPGIYNVTVQNSAACGQTLYGALSVVASSSGDIYREGQRIRTDYRSQGASVRVVANTVSLKSGYRKIAYLQLDTDRLLGENRLSRMISLDDSSWYEELETVSRWAGGSFFDLRVRDNSDSAFVRIGRVAPVLTGGLYKEIQPFKACSPFIEVSLYNVRLDQYNLRIPFDPQECMRFKVLRYDEELRTWSEHPAFISRWDHWAELSHNQSGIYVVVTY